MTYCQEGYLGAVKGGHSGSFYGLVVLNIVPN